MKKFLFLALFAVSLAGCQQKHPEIISQDFVPVTGANISDSSMIKLIEPYKIQMDSDMNIIIGTSAQPMSAALPEGLLNTFVANAMLSYGNQLKPTDISITNLGGLRNDIQEGPITIGDVMQVMPFDNALVFLELSGEDVEALCDAIAKKGGDVVAGISMKIEGDNAENILIQGQPIDDNKNYRIITTDYLSFGNDHLDPLAKFKTIEPLNVLLRDVLIQNIKDETAASRPIQPTLKNEIYVEQ